MAKKEWKLLDLHGVEHEEANFVIEKFITDNFKNLPVKIITGYSEFFIQTTQEISHKHELGCYAESPSNEGCWIIYQNKWKKA